MEHLAGKAPARAVGRVEELDPSRVALVLLALAMAASAALILWLERGTTFMSDEWSWAVASGLGSFEDLFKPINQHLLLIPLSLAKAFLSIWGMSLVPFQIAQLAGVIGCSAALYLYSRPRIGPLAALAPAMVPLFMGTATSVLLQPLLGVQAIYPLAFGIGALVAVERGDRAGDIAACVLLTLSLASFSSGVAFLAGVAVFVLLSEDRRRRSWVWLVPLLLFAAVRIWGMQFHSGEGPQLSNVPALPFYFVDSLAAVATSLFGRGEIVGKGPGASLFVFGFSLDDATKTLFFAAVEAAVIAFAARRVWRRRPVPAALWAAIAALVTLWVSQGLAVGEARMPGENRYLLQGAVLVVLVAVEVARGARLSRLGLGALLAVVLVGIAGNLPRFREGRDAIVYHAPRNLAYTGVMELGRESGDPEFVPVVETPIAAPAGALGISAGDYLELADRYGAIGYSPREILEQDEEIRHGADEVAVSYLGLAATEAPALPRRGCTRLAPAPAGEVVNLPPGGVLLRSDTASTVALRRFADRPVVRIGNVRAGRPAELRVPADSSPLPWELWVVEEAAVTVCPLASG
jgi:hypothetical protein